MGRTGLHRAGESVWFSWYRQNNRGLASGGVSGRANHNARVLLTTFSDTLANSLRTKLKRLVSNEPRLAERIDVHAINAIGICLYKSHFGPANLATSDVILELLTQASKEIGTHKFSLRFLHAEWDQVVDAWQLDSWEAYRDVARLGRKHVSQNNSEPSFGLFSIGFVPVWLPENWSRTLACSADWSPPWLTARTRRSTLPW